MQRLLGCCFCLAFALASASAEQVALSNGAETCLVDTCGARVLSYAVGGTEVIWDMDARLSGGTPWRHGGIPIAWPWFGRLGSGEDSIHGYAWKSPFKIKSQSKDSIALELEAEGLRLEYSIELLDGLRLMMRTTCTSAFPQPIGMAFHPYFRVGERDMTVLEGVYDGPVLCTNTVDSGVRFGEVLPRKEYLLHDRARQLSVRITATGSTGVNVGNPGAEKQCPGVIEGDEWRRFVAVEPYALGVNRFMVLRTGQQHELGMTVAVSPFCMPNRDEKTAGVSAVAVAGPLDELLPRPKEVRAEADGLLLCEGLPSGGYALRVRGGKTEVAAVDEAGRRYAEATLSQLRLLSDGVLPDCTIRDWPTFPWRGFMHDCGRNFLDVESVKQVIDLMAKYKLNLFHWHLTEYFAWRLESKKYPMLQAPWAFGRQHGMFYTQAQFREVIDYAKARGVTVMPELDVPGHSLAFRRGLGFEFMCDKKVKDIVIDLIDELCSLATPEEMPFIHLGTDESRTPQEMVPDSFCPAWAEAVWRNGRTPVGWSPGKDMTLADGRKAVKMMWSEGGESSLAPGERAFDTSYWYFGNYNPFAFLNYALFAKPCGWDIPDANKLGAVIASWHNDMAGHNGKDVLLNNNFALAVVMFSDMQWNGREKNRPELHFRMPIVGTPEFDEAVRFENSVAAQRDKALADSTLPFAWVRGMDMRWRLTNGATGEVVAEDIPGGCVQIHGFSPQGYGAETAYIKDTTGVAVLETWIKSPKDQAVGVWIDFMCCGRSGSRSSIAFESGALAVKGEWSASKGARVEVNGVAIPPPKWKNPGLKILGRSPDVATNNVSETPFEDDCCWTRPPSTLTLKAGWNHVKITAPKTFKAWHYGWQVLFVPVLGTRDHPREVPGLEYSSHPKKGTAKL